MYFQRCQPLKIEHTINNVLGGALRLAQPVKGFRFGTDSVLLSSAVPAAPGHKVLDLGTGSGVVAACIAHRVQETYVVAVDISADMVAIASWNMIHNNLNMQTSIIRADVEKGVLDIADNSFDHVVFNPPYFDPKSHQRAVGDVRSMARQGSGVGLDMWFKTARRYLKPNGTISVVMRTSQLDSIFYLLRSGFGGVEVFPFWPKRGSLSKTVVVRGVKGSKSETKLYPGIVLHNSDGSQTDAACQVLMSGMRLDAAQNNF